MRHLLPPFLFLFMVMACWAQTPATAATSAASTSGIGVASNAAATSGTAYGVYGTSASPSGYGVYGFKIAGGLAGKKVSWQVTGIRQDAWPNAHRTQVEVEKQDEERGTYIHPELFGQPETMSINYKRRPHPPHEP